MQKSVCIIFVLFLCLISYLGYLCLQRKVDYTDLGLGVYWLNCNLGANNPEDMGEYFAWGEVSPKIDFSENTYTIDVEEILENIEEYNMDPVSARLKKGMRMPSYDDVRELIDNCTWEWYSIRGTYGYKIISKINGNSIFIPAAGMYVGEYCGGPNINGYYWTISPSSGSNVYVFNISQEDGPIIYDKCRLYYGMTIRPVYEKKNK